jgi:hypothetical protein
MRSSAPIALLLCCLAGGTAQGLRQQQRLDDDIHLIYDEDISCPPGPKEGWPHSEPFQTTPDEQLRYNQALDEEFYLQNREFMLSLQRDRKERSSGNLLEEGIRIRQTHIASPQGSTTRHYTGVTHFSHVNDPNLVTLLFSAGRHDGGSNTYLTIDISDQGATNNPFAAAQETFIDEEDVSTYTWVSSYTQKDIEDGSVLHWALFSGGIGRGVVGPSKLYVFEEDSNGNLREPQLIWVEEYTQRGGARYCLLADLGDIYDGDKLVSKKGSFDILISGTGGLDIYSSNVGNDWQRIRTLPLVNEATDSNPTGAVSFMGVMPTQNKYLVISSRARWALAREKELPNAPSLVYDYQEDVVVQEFSSGGQSVSVALLDDQSQILLGAGGQADMSGQPNLLYEITSTDKSDVAIELSDVQLLKGTSTMYVPFESVDPYPVSSSEFFSIPRSGITKTRQVKSFSLLDSSAEIILEVNSAETCNLYYRENESVHASTILPLPGSQGHMSEVYGGVYARGGDILEVGDQVFIVFANYNGNNTVYSFDSRWLRGVDISLAEE